MCDEGYPQRELLEVHLKTFCDPISTLQMERNLSELLYTASETGLITAVDPAELTLLYKIIMLAQTIDPELLNKMKM